MTSSLPILCFCELRWYITFINLFSLLQVDSCGREVYPDYPVPPPSLSHPLPATYSLHPQHTTVTMTSTLQTLAFKLAPPSREAGPEQLEPCNDGAGRRYEVVPSVVCSMCCLFGIIYCFFGELSHPCLLMHHQETIFVCITTKWCYFYRWKPIDLHLHLCI